MGRQMGWAWEWNGMHPIMNPMGMGMMNQMGMGMGMMNQMDMGMGNHIMGMPGMTGDQTQKMEVNSKKLIRKVSDIRNNGE